MTDRPDRLIQDGPVLLVFPALAREIGLFPAIVLQQLYFRAVRESGGWVRKQLEDWRADDFPFRSTDQINRAFKALERRGLVAIEQLASYDRTRRYRPITAAVSELDLGGLQIAALEEGTLRAQRQPRSAQIARLPISRREEQRKGQEQRPRADDKQSRRRRRNAQLRAEGGVE